MNVMHRQIINLFNNPQDTMFYGLWLDGYEGEGKYKEWFDNGKLCLHGFYKNNKKEGEYKQWDYGGILYRHHFYKNSKLVKDYLK